jgi:hypothetical protein
MKVFRTIAIVSGTCVALVSGLLAISPTVISTSWGKELCVSLANRYYPGSLKIESLSCGWFSGLDIQNCDLHDPDGKQILSFKRFLFRKSLVSLLFSQKDFGEIDVQSPTVFLYETPPLEKPSQHKEKARNESPKTPKNNTNVSLQEMTTPDLRGHVKVTDAKVIAVKDSKIVGQLAGNDVDINLDLQHTTTGAVKATLIDQKNTSTPLQLLFTLKGSPLLANMKGNFQFSCDQVTTESLSLFAAAVDPSLPSILQECFGSSLSYNLKASVDDGAFACQSVLDSQNIKSSLSLHIENDVCTIDQGQFLQGTLTPSLVRHASRAVSLEKPVFWSLESSKPIIFDLATKKLQPFLLRFSPDSPIPLVINGKNLLVQLGLEAKKEGETASVNIFASSLLEPASLRLTSSATLEGNEYKTTSSVALSGTWPRLVDSLLQTSLASAIGSTCDSSVTATIQSRKDEQKAPFQINASIIPNVTEKSPLALLLQNKPLQIDLDGVFSPQLITCSKIHVTSTPFLLDLQDIECDISQNSLAVTMQTPGSFLCTLPQEFVPLPSPLKVQGTVHPMSISAKKGVVRLDLSARDISLPNSKPCTLSLPISFDMSTSQAIVNLDLHSPDASIISGAMTASLSKECNGTIALKQLPITILDGMTKKPISQAIGDTISGNINFNYEGESSHNNTISGAVRGSFWNAALDLTLDQMILSSRQKEALSFDAKISKEAFEALKKTIGISSSISPVDPITCQFAVLKPSLDLSSLLNNSSVSAWLLLQNASLQAKVSLSPIVLSQDSTVFGKFAPLSSSFTLNGKDHQIQYTLDAKSRSLDEVNLHISGDVKNAWNETCLTLNESSIVADINIDRLPVRLVDIAMPQKADLLEQSIGKTLSISGTCSLEKMKSGKILLDVKAKHAFLHLDGVVKDGVLTLQNPATANLEVTKEAGSLLLKDINPILSTTVHAEKPITVTIDPRGTSIPLSPYNPANLSIPKATIDVGKLLVKNTGALKVILALLRLGKAANSDEIDVWLTPLYVRVDHGTINCLRADALVANDLHIITWGNMDLKSDTIDMIVAIPPESLRHIGINIVSTTPERGLQIPIKGATSNPKVDTTKAAGKIAGSTMMSGSKDSRVQLLGGLIQAASSINDSDQPIPAPTTQPFPWERR